MHKGCLLYGRLYINISIACRHRAINTTLAIPWHGIKTQSTVSGCGCYGVFSETPKHPKTPKHLHYCKATPLPSEILSESPATTNLLQACVLQVTRYVAREHLICGTKPLPSTLCRKCIFPPQAAAPNSKVRCCNRGSCFLTAEGTQPTPVDSNYPTARAIPSVAVRDHTTVR